MVVLGTVVQLPGDRPLACVSKTHPRCVAGHEMVTVPPVYAMPSDFGGVAITGVTEDWLESVDS